MRAQSTNQLEGTIFVKELIEKLDLQHDVKKTFSSVMQKCGIEADQILHTQSQSLPTLRKRMKLMQEEQDDKVEALLNKDQLKIYQQEISLYRHDRRKAYLQTRRNNLD